ncbi:heme-binding protein [Nonomuraea sp. CA-141351]|uniref:heme-binding protein n=1 Tax=Nonomuraea sp. CA-141351 TaxID=3239996 RepID=UPI003D931F22
MLFDRTVMIAVLDPGGHVKVLLRQDDAGYPRVAIAIAKAWGALGMGQSGHLTAIL